LNESQDNGKLLIAQVGDRLQKLLAGISGLHSDV